MNERLNDKYSQLKGILKGCGSVLIAFSGGVDSTFLAKVAHDLLGKRALAVTSVSPSLPESELEEAKKIAEGIGVAHRLIETKEMDDPKFLENDYQRCFFCKTELFQELFRMARSEGYRCVLYGANVDDREDFRPGAEAAKGSGALAPLMDAGLTKDEIRLLSKELGLSTWNKPSKACLSSRIPFGDRITVEKLKQVEEAEEALSRLGFHQFRVRHHNQIARIEIQQEELERMAQAETRAEVIEAVKEAGFKFVTLDLEGYRTGPFNPPSHNSENEEA
jgi:uncharacterized protein